MFQKKRIESTLIFNDLDKEKLDSFKNQKIVSHLIINLFETHSSIINKE